MLGLQNFDCLFRFRRLTKRLEPAHVAEQRRDHGAVRSQHAFVARRHNCVGDSGGKKAFQAPHPLNFTNLRLHPVAKLGVQSLKRIELPDVLDSDDCLGGEAADQFNVLVRKWRNLTAVEYDAPISQAGALQRYNKDAGHAFLIDHLHAILVAAFVEIAVREIVETNGFAVKR